MSLSSSSHSSFKGRGGASLIRRRWFGDQVDGSAIARETIGEAIAVSVEELGCFGVVPVTHCEKICSQRVDIEERKGWEVEGEEEEEVVLTKPASKFGAVPDQLVGTVE